MGFPNNFNKKSLLNKVNRNEVNSFLDKNINRNLLNINFWNQKLIVESYDKDKNKNFERSFVNLFFLTKNNKEKNLDLKRYFISNFNYFSDPTKKIILENRRAVGVEYIRNGKVEIVNCEGEVLNRPNNLSRGPALVPQTSKVRKTGINAAIPAPSQCILPVIIKYKVRAKISQKPLLHRNGLRLFSAKCF